MPVNRKGRTVLATEGGAVVAAFSWGRVPVKSRGAVRKLAAEILTAVRLANEHLVRVGQLLREIKQEIGHGLFGAWVEKEFPWSPRTARYLMGMADVFGSVETAILARIDQTALYQLSSNHVPEEARTETLRLAESGERVTAERAREIVQQHRGQERRPSPPVGEELYSGRLDAMYEHGEMELEGDPYMPPAATVRLTYGEYKLLLARLFRDPYPEEEMEPEEPTDRPPGSAAKRAVMALRVAAGKSATRRGDQGGDDDHVPDIHPRAGGAGAYCPTCRRRMPPPPVVGDHWRGEPEDVEDEGDAEG